VSAAGDRLPLPTSVSLGRLGGDSLAATLGIPLPPLSDPATAFKQLNALTAYARDTLAAQSILIENEYVDRDHMEDHSVFYSKSLTPYPNRCRRISFFSLSVADLERELAGLLETIRADRTQYDEVCSRFSDAFFVGFSVVRPLPGSPVGRSILRPPKGADVVCSPRSRIHILGLEMTVAGVPYQQQDVAVSACATTALWSSLQAASYQEPLRGATPAQITMLASKHALPFGRPMPSEGLSTGQMCQAIDALGVAPSLLKAEDYEDTRGCLYAALRSGVAPVLILQPIPSGLDLHAVCAVGMYHDEKALKPLASLSNAIDVAGQLAALLIHDDRTAPYVRCKLFSEAGRPALELPDGERWRVYQVIVPTHPKIRLSLLTLRRIAATHLAPCAFEAAIRADAAKGDVSFECWIERSHEYHRRLVQSCSAGALANVLRLGSEILLPRYLAVITLGGIAGRVHVLVDTTSTEKNLNVLAVLDEGRTAISSAVAKALVTLLRLDEDQLIDC
jgi:hypothetical protein